MPLLGGEHVSVGEAVAVLGGELGYRDAEVVFVFGCVFELGWIVLAGHFCLGLGYFRVSFLDDGWVFLGFGLVWLVGYLFACLSVTFVL